MGTLLVGQEKVLTPMSQASSRAGRISSGGIFGVQSGLKRKPTCTYRSRIRTAHHSRRRSSTSVHVSGVWSET